MFGVDLICSMYDITCGGKQQNMPIINKYLIRTIELKCGVMVLHEYRIRKLPIYSYSYATWKIQLLAAHCIIHSLL